MRFSTILSGLAALAAVPLTSAVRVIQSNSLNTCMENSNFTANLFIFSLTPDNSSASIEINGFSSISGYVVANVELIAYGFTAFNQTLNPCDMNLAGFCPMVRGPLNLPESTIPITGDTLKNVPGVAFTVPDLDGVVRLKVFSVTDQGGIGQQVACLETDLSNTKTVYQKAVGWVTAFIAGLGLIAAGITSGLGNPNTAAHVAANAVSLFGVFQAQAIIGLTSVTMPPIVQSWTQNFQWSMGIIHVSFLQTLATWYQRATGGTPTTYLSTLSTISVQVEKRKMIKRVVARTIQELSKAVEWIPTRAVYKRATGGTTTDSTDLKNVIVRGIARVGFRARIEKTNIFMTGLIFFVGVLILIGILVALAKAALEGAARAGWMKSDKFRDFRNGWKIVIKGILFRLVLLGFVQMSVLCLWELTERDSAAEVVLAIVVFLSMAGCLAWASWKVISLARRSVEMHKNAAYILYSDPTCLNKWGFLYVSYKATAYWFVVVLLCYIVVKATFIAFAQSAPVVQAIGLVIVEAAFLIGVSILRPWMDKKTNVFNISIAVVNFLNAIFLLVFSNVFDQPPMVSGVMGVIFALYNVIFIAVLLILVLIASIYAIASKNPETRYQPMRDDRGSFIKSQSALTTELDALGVTARGDGKLPYPSTSKDVDEVSTSSESLSRPTYENQQHLSVQHGMPRYSDVPGRTQSPYSDRSGYAPQVRNQEYHDNSSRPSVTSSPYQSQQSFSRPMQQQYPPSPRSANGYGPQQFHRPQNQNRGWQTGAGYD